MGAAFRDLLSDLYEVLRVDHSAAVEYSGTYDLSDVSGTPRVVWGEGFPKHVVPAVLLSGLQLRTAYSGANIGEYEERGRIEWWGICASPDLTPENRALAAVDLANDVISSIQTARQDQSYPALFGLTECLVTLEDVFGDAQDMAPGYAVAWGYIDFMTSTGRGV